MDQWQEDALAESRLTAAAARIEAVSDLADEGMLYQYLAGPLCALARELRSADPNDDPIAVEIAEIILGAA